MFFAAIIRYLSPASSTDSADATSDAVFPVAYDGSLRRICIPSASPPERR